MAAPRIEVISSRSLVGEGPHWDHEEQVLYYVDIWSSTIYKYNPSTKKETKLKIEGGTVSFIIPLQGQKDKFAISIGRSFAILTWDGISDKPISIEKIATVDVEDEKTKNQLNDGKADPIGRLWAGTLSPIAWGNLTATKKLGSLFSLSKDKTVKTHVTGIGCSNGITWSLDQKIMYYIDTIPRQVYAFDFDAQTGQISNRRTIFDFAVNNTKGYPDGMTIDTEGMLWIACYNGHQVICVDPQSGKLLRSLQMPTLNITSVAFGGPNLDELFVTSISMHMSEEELKAQPSAGCTFHVTGIGAKGFAGQPVIL